MVQIHAQAEKNRAMDLHGTRG